MWRKGRRMFEGATNGSEIAGLGRVESTFSLAGNGWVKANAAGVATAVGVPSWAEQLISWKRTASALAVLWNLVNVAWCRTQIRDVDLQWNVRWSVGEWWQGGIQALRNRQCALPKRHLILTLNSLTLKIRWAPNNASRWQMGFNWAFRGLMYRVIQEENAIFWWIIVSIGDRGSTVVKVLCYKSEGRWFDSRWWHW